MDDGTGVINCLCWKNDLLREEGDPTKCEFPITMDKGISLVQLHEL